VLEWPVGGSLSVLRCLSRGSVLGQSSVGYCLTFARQYNVNIIIMALLAAWVCRLWLEHHATEPWLYRLGCLCARAVELVVVVTVSLRPGVGLRLTAAVVSLQRVYIYQQPYAA